MKLNDKLTITNECNNLNLAVVNRYLKNGFKPFETKARYFSDFIKNKEWFYGI